MTSKKCIEKGNEALNSGDWNVANAAFSVVIEKRTTDTQGKTKKDNSNTTGDELLGEAYLGRAKACCYLNTKTHNEGNYRGIIDDASRALVFLPSKRKKEVLVVRAYGCYLCNELEMALDDCKVLELDGELKEEDKTFVLELTGLVYQSLGRYLEATQYIQQVLLYHNRNELVSPLLMNAYRDACSHVKGN